MLFLVFKDGLLETKKKATVVRGEGGARVGEKGEGK